MSTRACLTVAAALATTAAVVAVARSEPARGPVTLQQEFGMLGLGSAQTARINAVNFGNPNDWPISLEVELGFRDGNGAAIGPELRRTLGPGESAFLDVDFTAIAAVDRNPTSSRHARIRAMVQVTGSLLGLGNP